MKYHRIATACGFALSLVLCAFALGGCELFVEDPPPQLVIKNESSGPITRVEFWEETPELETINSRAGEAFFKQFTDIANCLKHTAEYIAALYEYEVAAKKVAQTMSPLIEDNTVIPVGGSRSWDLETGKGYIVRVNGVLSSATMNRGSLDTVYVFDGKDLLENER
jgi:hypothetical protein